MLIQNEDINVLVTNTNTGEKSSIVKPRYTLTLANVYGATMLSKTISSGVPIQLDAQLYPPGMYILSVKGSDGTVQSKKVIKIGQ